MAMDFPLPTSVDHLWVCILTARCNMACSYCIQKGMVLPDRPRRPWCDYDELSGREWVRSLNGLPVRPERPLILTGGEPSLHRDFLEIVTGLEGYELDLTTNLSLDLEAVARAMDRAGKRFTTSFHTYAPDHMTPEEFLAKAEFIRQNGLTENPYFNTIDLEWFPQFRTPEATARVGRLRTLAAERGIPLNLIEFRANHMGSPYARQEKRTMECSSGWVNLAPDGGVFNCQYHLTARKSPFGNITDPARLRPLPRLGTFFSCSDFGWCDPCHENSGRGFFRHPGTEQTFRRDEQASPLEYARLLSTDQLVEGGHRFVDEGKPKAATAFLLEAFNRTEDPVLLNDLGVALWNDDRPREAFECFSAAIRKGCPDPACSNNLLLLAEEIGETARAQSALLDSGILVPEKPPAPKGTSYRIRVDIQGYWGLGDLLCADPMIDALTGVGDGRPVEIRITGKAGNLLHHPAVAGVAPEGWEADRVVEVPFLTHAPREEYDRLEALPSLIDHMAAYAGVQPRHRRPRLHLTAEERELAARLPLVPDQGEPVIALCSDFFDPYRHWPRERWKRVARHLVQRGAKVVEMGIQPALGAGLDLGDGKLPIRVVAAVLERCDLFLGNNTGTFHYAQAAGVPCLTLFSIALPQRFIHDGALVVPVQADLPCVNCRTRTAGEGGETVCPHSSPGRCMEAIPVDRVTAEVDRFLDGYHATRGPGGAESAAGRAWRLEQAAGHVRALEAAGFHQRARELRDHNRVLFGDVLAPAR